MARVKKCYLESNGQFSVLLDGGSQQGTNREESGPCQSRAMNNEKQLPENRFLHTIFAMERDLIVGGQAVMEGVMMRTPSAYAIACRKSDGVDRPDCGNASEMER